MWQQHAELLSNEIEAVLSKAPREGRFYNIVRKPLAVKFRHLTRVGKRYKAWPVLPLAVCEAVSGKYKKAIPAAAAVTLFTAAADVFDDIEDASSPLTASKQIARARANNAATTLLILAELALLRLREKGVDCATTIKVAETANSYYAKACFGQHLDIINSGNGRLPENRYLRMIQMKTGSQVECACVVGAILGKAPQKTVAAFAEFGRSLGMAAQISNDIKGILNGQDIEEGKVTLAETFIGPEKNKTGRKKLNPIEVNVAKQRLLESGGVFYAAVKMEEYRQHAENILNGLEKTGVNINMLRDFVHDNN